ncbi:hypothetical protein CCP2SC5_950017 [Azospirillaceae bacterium]
MSGQKTQFSVKRMATDLQCLLTHFRINQPIVIGHSMGALTLWQYIADYGCDAIKCLGIIDQSPRLITDSSWGLGIYGEFSAERNQAFIESLHRDFPRLFYGW